MKPWNALAGLWSSSGFQDRFFVELQLIRNWPALAPFGIFLPPFGRPLGFECGPQIVHFHERWTSNAEKWCPGRRREKQTMFRCCFRFINGRPREAKTSISLIHVAKYNTSVFYEKIMKTKGNRDPKMVTKSSFGLAGVWFLNFDMLYERSGFW